MSINYKNTNAERTTITRDLETFSGQTGNIYQALIAISKRSNQISSEMREELTGKLAEFASTTESKLKSLNSMKAYRNRFQLLYKSF